ncbi:hypothetical protein HGH93_27205 [Chitinophaga polysaccharea]|uniref:hypothetical protein n=1 Tax=Chitinophaga TaxID=79328 RepID=UPI0014559D19|nr:MULTISPECIES: hypothetical protein [Chitinophaga]NLR61814.1 hypothetical protein [Chitinophaga polysaccharea]NLU92682.1 hypothetical protein [Chitinophaga sp. Ak27]
MDHIKSYWDNTPTPQKNILEIQALAEKKTSPVLMSIRKQLTIEIVSYSAFLLVYYDFFDGNKKPLSLNLLLVAAMLLLLIHNAVGYTLSKRPVLGENLLDNLRKKSLQIKQYAVVSISSKILAMAGIFSFFLGTGIQWNNARYTALAAIAGILCVQGYLLWRVWAARVKRMNTTIAELS